MTGPDTVAATQLAYTRMAARYAERWDRAGADWVEEPAERLAADLPPHALVADVGCGPGNDTVRLRARGLRVHGFDLSHAMLTARDVPGQVRADLRRLPLADGRLDALWCVAVLLHIPRDQVPAALAEFHRVLRPGGLGVISIAQGEGEGWERYTFQDGGIDRYFVYHAAGDFAALVTAAGLEIRDTTSRRTHRDWLTLHVRRPPGVH